MFKVYGLHFDFCIEQCVQADFVSGMPNWHVEMPDQERTDGLVEHVKEEPSVKFEMSIITKIKIIQIIYVCNIPIQE